MLSMKADIIIIGGSIGGCMAAYSAARLGKKVILTEETDWIGGQFTSQAVPPDEHLWVEKFGCTDTYRDFRQRVRRYYRDYYPLKEKERNNPFLNPGNAWVSRLAFEPKVALKIFYDFLHPYLSNGQVTLLLNYYPISVSTHQDQINNIVIENNNEQRITLTGHYYLDATECGDLLPLANVDYRLGAESKQMTGEPSALERYIKEDVQSLTQVFALEYKKGENHMIDKPDMYDDWKNYQAPFLAHKQLSWKIPDAQTGHSKMMRMFNKGQTLGLWEYRRIIDKQLFAEGFYQGDISLINWPQNDYWLGSIIDVTKEEKLKHLHMSKQLSMSLLYWLQTEAPRPDGGKGYPGLRLRPDVVGTADGIAKHPYIRESRRIVSYHTVKEQHINASFNHEGVKQYEDSVGIGAYRIDLHPTVVTNRLFYAPSYPFEIPLGSFIPIRMKNLLPSCKNIGCTHITNGCMRVHPVEWNIGESAGALAVFAINVGKHPVDIYQNKQLVKEYQSILQKLGVNIHWPQLGVL